MREDTRCHNCGAKMVTYKHTMSVPLIQGLYKLAKAGGGPINLKQLALTRNQWDNFQKLRYWGLVARSFHSDGTRRAGVWELTDQGSLFLAGVINVRKSVRTYRGEFKKWEGGRTTVQRVYEGYRKREDYVSDQEPISP